MCVSGRLKCGLIRWAGKYDNISFRIKTPYHKIKHYTCEYGSPLLVLHWSGPTKQLIVCLDRYFPLLSLKKGKISWSPSSFSSSRPIL